MITKDAIQAYNENYSGLRGAKILEFYMEQCDFDPDHYWPTFRMQNGKDVFKFILSQDPEGNGSGFAFIEDV